jgi:hypothetical protein
MTDPKNTTLYNHFKIGSKDVIPNKVYKELLEAIDAGNLGELCRCKELYDLTTEQLTLAEMKIAVWQNNCIQP